MRLKISQLPWIVLAAGLCTTALFCESQRRFNQREHVRIERDLANAVVDAIRNKLDGNQALLDAVAGLFTRLRLSSAPIALKLPPSISTMPRSQLQPLALRLRW